MTHDMPTRIVTEGEFKPEEYDAHVSFIGWEDEHVQGNEGWTCNIEDNYHNVHIQVKLTKDAQGNLVVIADTKVKP